MDKNSIKLINSIDFWKSEIKISPVGGGITNKNFLVEDSLEKYFVRIGDDIPEHLVFRSNEIQASNAASKIGVSPTLLFHDQSIQVFNFINGKTFDSNDIKNNLEEITELIKKVHKKIPDQLVGQSVIFWVFYVIKYYANFLIKNESNHIPIINELLDKNEKLETLSSPRDIVFGHNDLLAANILDDGDQLWLIDWEYGGFNTPLFDLAGLAGNNGLSILQEQQMLEQYFDRSWDIYWRPYQAMKCISLMRETLWSMVSEIYSEIEFDYGAYTSENLSRLSSAISEFQQI